MALAICFQSQSRAQGHRTGEGDEEAKGRQGERWRKMERRRETHIHAHWHNHRFCICSCWCLSLHPASGPHSSMTDIYREPRVSAPPRGASPVSELAPVQVPGRIREAWTSTQGCVLACEEQRFCACEVFCACEGQGIMHEGPECVCV